MAKFKVTGVYFDARGVEDFLNDNPQFKSAMMEIGQGVAAEARATADDAQEGPGGTISGYAEAGFTVEWERGFGKKRPRVNVISGADPETAHRAHFNTQMRDGIAHMRKALYKFTTRG